MMMNQGVVETRPSSYHGYTSYDSGVIEQFADKLYSRATAIVVLYVLLGLLFGAVSGYAGYQYFRIELAGWIAGAVVVVIAFFLGQQRAFQLRLQAQIALCQVQIEKNTRGLSSR